MAQSVTTHRHASACPHCGANLGARDGLAPPLADTYTICWTCREIVRIDAELNGCPLSDIEEAAVLHSPELRRVVGDIRERVASLAIHRLIRQGSLSPERN